MTASKRGVDREKFWVFVDRMVAGEQEIPPMRGADDDDFEDEIVEFTPGGGASAASGEHMASDGLLTLFGEVQKLAVLLSEASEEDFVVLAPRLRLLKAAIEALPDTPKPRRRVGFVPPAKAGRKTAPKKRRGGASK